MKCLKKQKTKLKITKKEHIKKEFVEFKNKQTFRNEKMS